MNIKVYSRVRPLSLRQKECHSGICIETKGPISRLFNIDEPESYRDFIFDGTFENYGKNKSALTSQKQVFQQVGLQTLESAENGYHCCVLAYGQTGSGKTFTMMGCQPQCEGIIPRVSKQLFKRIQSNENKNKVYQVAFSMLELYNQSIRDLQNINNQNCRIKQNKGGLYIDNLIKKKVQSSQQLSQQIKSCNIKKAINQTRMSNQSSRSHTITTIQLKQIIQLQGVLKQRLSIMHFVDLAGSQRIGKVSLNGDRLKQAASIGKSLSSLGRVICAIVDKSRGKDKIHVPYRDSKITHILQNALGGNCKTTLICTLSPAQCNHDETLSTLRFADMMRRVQNKIYVNQTEIKKEKQQKQTIINNPIEKKQQQTNNI